MLVWHCCIGFHSSSLMCACTLHVGRFTLSLPFAGTLIKMNQSQAIVHITFHFFFVHSSLLCYAVCVCSNANGRMVSLLFFFCCCMFVFNCCWLLLRFATFIIIFYWNTLYARPSIRLAERCV